MDTTVLAAILSASGVFITAVSGLLIARKNANKDITVNQQSNLSENEKSFRDIILADNNRMRTEIEQLSTKLNVLMVEKTRLQVRIVELEGRGGNQTIIVPSVNEDDDS